MPVDKGEGEQEEQGGDLKSEKEEREEEGLNLRTSVTRAVLRKSGRD
jgi:hypothetical protein